MKQYDIKQFEAKMTDVKAKTRWLEQNKLDIEFSLNVLATSRNN